VRRTGRKGATAGGGCDRAAGFLSRWRLTAAELLEQEVRKYQNHTIETILVIEELIQLAKDMRAASARSEALNLTEDELAFYDSL